VLTDGWKLCIAHLLSWDLTGTRAVTGTTTSFNCGTN